MATAAQPVNEPWTCGGYLSREEASKKEKDMDVELPSWSAMKDSAVMGYTDTHNMEQLTTEQELPVLRNEIEKMRQNNVTFREYGACLTALVSPPWSHRPGFTALVSPPWLLNYSCS